MERRVLRIKTWGKKKHKWRPEDSQWNLAITRIHLYNHMGLDLKHMTGRTRKIQKVLEDDPEFDVYWKRVLAKLESPLLHTVSISCEKGRHRSVAFAEVVASRLRAQGYRVHVVHLDI